MQYDLIKDKLSDIINVVPAFRQLFYRMLDFLLLRQRYVKTLMKEINPQNAKLRYHDAGAGFCQYSWFVLEHWEKADVHASDLKDDYLSQFAGYAKERYGNRFSWKTADLQDYQPSRKFDLITAIDILEHIPDDISVLQHFYNSMQSRAKLIISTPSDLDEAAKFTAEHVRPGYNKAELEQKLTDVGFNILSSKFTYGRFGALSWKLMMKFPLSLLGKNPLYIITLPVYYLLIFPFAEILMHLDQKTNNASGTGLLVLAEKP